MKFCSECGAPVASRRVAHDTRRRFSCEICGTVHYDNPRVIVGCYAHWHDRVLFCRRAQPPAAGRWSIPSGYLEHGETLQMAAAREAREECGLVLDPADLDLYAVWSMTPIGQIGVSFRVRLETEPALHVGVECTEVALLDEDEVPFDLLAWPVATVPQVRAFYSQLRAGHFGIHLRELASNGSSEVGARRYG